MILEIHLEIGLKCSEIRKGMKAGSDWAEIQQEPSGKPPN